MIRSIIIFFLVCLSLKCEEDDICAKVSPTTPLLIVRFYDSKNPLQLKEVTNLSIKGKEKEKLLSPYIGTNTDSIAIPLKVFDNKVIYHFIKDYKQIDAKETDNQIEEVTFEYTLKEKFLYRGCGFIMNFHDIKTKNTSTTPWIKSIDVISNVENQTHVHVKVYH